MQAQYATRVVAARPCKAENYLGTRSVTRPAAFLAGVHSPRPGCTSSPLVRSSVRARASAVAHPSDAGEGRRTALFDSLYELPPSASPAEEPGLWQVIQRMVLRSVQVAFLGAALLFASTGVASAERAAGRVGGSTFSRTSTQAAYVKQTTTSSGPAPQQVFRGTPVSAAPAAVPSTTATSATSVAAAPNSISSTTVNNKTTNVSNNTVVNNHHHTTVIHDSSPSLGSVVAAAATVAAVSSLTQPHVIAAPVMATPVMATPVMAGPVMGSSAVISPVVATPVVVSPFYSTTKFIVSACLTMALLALLAVMISRRD